MALTFRGGIRIEENKRTKRSAVVKMPAPETVSISLSNDEENSCVPTVNIGDKVEWGQSLCTSENGYTVHASVSGIISDIKQITDEVGKKVTRVVIKNDGENRISSEISPFKKPISEITLEDVIDIAKKSGIVDASGFAISQKLKTVSEKYEGKIEYLIINCVEPPEIYSGYRLVTENPAAVINGLKILIKGLGLRRGFVAVDDGRLDAANSIEALIRKSKLVTVKILKEKYPQNDERQIVYSITGRRYEVGEQAEDAGCLIFDAASCAAIYYAFTGGIPSIERIITVAGDCIKKSGNFLVPIGTQFKDLIEFCGGTVKDPYMVVDGSLMNGKAVWDMSTPVDKNTSAVFVMSEKAVFKNSDGNCIRCGRCVEACPMQLMPVYILEYAKKNIKDREKLKKIGHKYSVEKCNECGVCTYVCPGEVRLSQYIQLFKEQLRITEKSLNKIGEIPDKAQNEAETTDIASEESSIDNDTDVDKANEESDSAGKSEAESVNEKIKSEENDSEG